MPVEATENIAPVVVWRKELRPDSGGAGHWRGGLGQVMEIGGSNGAPFNVLAMFDRVRHPPRGRDGGYDGAAGEVRLASGKQLNAKGEQTIPPHDRLVMELPGGAGFGNPAERDPEHIARDVRNGVVAPESARTDYRVILRTDGSLDSEATVSLRNS